MDDFHMTMIIRAADGQIINIGPWNEEHVQVGTGVFRQIGEDEHGPIFKEILTQVATNPLPDGAYEDEAEIVTGWDGGLYETNDPRRLPPDER